MPEIAEVARTVHFLRHNLLGKTLKSVTAAADDIVFGKVGTSAGEIEKALTGRKVLDVGQQGKYFWMIMDKPPHPVMHFGMSGWFRYKGQETYYYKGKEGKDGVEQWPPKFWKFHVVAEAKGKDTVEAAFVDMRRLARVRLVDCEGKEIRKNTPLKENGPDPVIDKNIVTVEWLTGVCRKKKVPIKAMLLDQAVISGIGNWVGDEVMYHSKIHPEQYSNTLQDSQIEQLHESIHYVCGTACDLLADSDKFPETWLFKHRWGKGKKNSTQTLPNGEKIVFLKVGGRTSAVVPSLQKKTGPVAKDIEESDGEVEQPAKSQGKKRKAAMKEDEDDTDSEDDSEVKKEVEEKQEEEKTRVPKKTARNKSAKQIPKESESKAPVKNGTTKAKPTANAKSEPKNTADFKAKAKATATAAPKKKTAAAGQQSQQPPNKRAKKSETDTATTAKAKAKNEKSVKAEEHDDGRRRSTRTTRRG